LFSNYILYSLREIQDVSILKNFKCALNRDIELFLKEKASIFDKRNISKTYLLIDIKKRKVVAYFALSITTFISINKISKTKIKLIDGFSKSRECLFFYLIGQLGVDDFYREKHKNRNLGNLVLDYAMDIIQQSQNLVGGRFVLVDAINNSKVINFYKKNGFIKFYDNKETIKMIYSI